MNTIVAFHAVRALLQEKAYSDVWHGIQLSVDQKHYRWEDFYHLLVLEYEEWERHWRSDGLWRMTRTEMPMRHCATDR